MFLARGVTSVLSALRNVTHVSIYSISVYIYIYIFSACVIRFWRLKAFPVTADLHRALYLQRSVCKPRNQHEIVLWVLAKQTKRTVPWLGRHNKGRDDSSFHSLYFLVFYGVNYSDVKDGRLLGSEYTASQTSWHVSDLKRSLGQIILYLRTQNLFLTSAPCYLFVLPVEGALLIEQRKDI